MNLLVFVYCLTLIICCFFYLFYFFIYTPKMVIFFILVFFGDLWIYQCDLSPEHSFG
jgi:hypothetical protein